MPRPRRNYVRRSLGLIACLFLPLSFIASAVYRLRHPLSPNTPPVATIVPALAAIFLALAALIAVLNLYLAFIRPWSYRRKTGLDDVRHDSGIPGLGTLLLIPVLLFGFGTPYLMFLGVLVSAIDVGGLPWFLIMTWRDSSFWDEPRPPRSDR